MGEPSGTPAGWYPDANAPGGQRYWDGQQWTDFTAVPSVVSDAAPAEREPMAPKPIWKRGWFIAAAAVAVVFLIGGIGSALGQNNTGTTASGATGAPSESSTPTFESPTPSATETPPSPTPTPSTPTPKPTPTKPAPPAPTASQEQALGAAQDYLDTQAFSRAGLIQQLSSSYGSGFSKADATWAVDHLTVSWYAQAVKAAQEYLSFEHFSCRGLVNQLDSRYGSQFTKSQATYAAKQLGLC